MAYTNPDGRVSLIWQSAWSLLSQGANLFSHPSISSPSIVAYWIYNSNECRSNWLGLRYDTDNILATFF